MSSFEEAQAPIDLYGFRNSLSLYVHTRSVRAFDRADRRRNKVNTKEAFLKYQANAKKAFVKSVGAIAYDANLPLDAKVKKTSIWNGIRIENVIFQSRKGVFVTANLYMPEYIEGKLPAVLLQCGHSPAGRLALHYRRGAAILAKAGFVVLIMDPLGQGERRYYPEIFDADDPPTQEHQYVGNQCILAGESMIKYFIADAKRALDYLQTRPEVDANKIGATGVSGGGTMSAVIGIMDDRIKAVAPGIFITARREYMYSGQWQDAEQIWFGTTKDNFDHYELISCVCPKPYMILGAKSDFFCREGTQKVYEKSKAFYKLFGARENIQITWVENVHAYDPLMAKAAAEFFAKVFTGRKINAEIIEPPEEDADFRATETGSLLTDGYGETPVFEANKAVFLKKKCADAKEMLLKNIYNKRSICPLYVRHLPKEIADGMVYEKIFWFSQEYMPCYAVIFKPEEKRDEILPVTICLWPEGTNAIVKHQKEIAEITGRGRAAMVVDLSGMGKSAPHPNATCISESLAAWKLNCDLMFLGDSLCAIRMFDLLNTIEMLKAEYGVGEISLCTEGNFSTYTDILKAIGREIASDCKSPVSPHSVITNKNYDNTQMENIAMFGIGIYLK